MRNKTARRKNLSENGFRDFEEGSKPHSNGEFVSVVCNLVEDIIFIRIEMIRVIVITVIIEWEAMARIRYLS